MQDMKRRALLATLAAAAVPLPAAAQQPASGRTRIVVPLGPGSVSDVIARLLAPHMATNLGYPVIVENKPGANGIIGVQEVMKAAPDGGTLLLGSVSPLAINVALTKNLPYDPRRDLTPVAGVYSAHHVIAVKSNFEGRTMADFIAFAKRQPGKVAIGTSSNLVKAQVLAINKMAGIEILEVPYKDTVGTFTDVIGGTLHAAFTDITTVMPHVKAGTVKVLAVTSGKRNPVVPDWPAVSETLSGYDFASWSALVGPTGMSRETVNRLAASVAFALKQKEFHDRLTQSGAIPWATTPDELKTYVDAQVAKWIALARDLNIQPE